MAGIYVYLRVKEAVRRNTFASHLKRIVVLSHIKSLGYMDCPNDFAIAISTLSHSVSQCLFRGTQYGRLISMCFFCAIQF